MATSSPLQKAYERIRKLNNLGGTSFLKDEEESNIKRYLFDELAPEVVFNALRHDFVNRATEVKHEYQRNELVATTTVPFNRALAFIREYFDTHPAFQPDLTEEGGVFIDKRPYIQNLSDTLDELFPKSKLFLFFEKRHEAFFSPRIESEITLYETWLTEQLEQAPLPLAPTTVSLFDDSSEEEPIAMEIPVAVPL
ncbi:MAG: hypothetical protein ACE365_01330 [Gammaproteobacteria bacterium]